jgi:transposase-like protein
MQMQMKQMTPEQRWNAIQTGIQQGKSNRQIARDFKCDEATIRRERTLMKLPDDWTQDIKRGYPAELFLRAKREQDATQRRSQRTQEEQATGVHSDRTARVVVLFLWNDMDLDYPNVVRVVDDPGHQGGLKA